jgi:hypothetical protein
MRMAKAQDETDQDADASAERQAIGSSESPEPPATAIEKQIRQGFVGSRWRIE